MTEGLVEDQVVEVAEEPSMTEVELYIEEIDSDDDSLESHLKNLVRKSKTNQIRQD